MGMLVVQCSGSYGENLFGTSSTHAPSVDKNTAVALSVAHIALNYLSEKQNHSTTNGRPFK